MQNSKSMFYLIQCLNPSLKACWPWREEPFALYQCFKNRIGKKCLFFQWFLFLSNFCGKEFQNNCITPKHILGVTQDPLRVLIPLTSLLHILLCDTWDSWSQSWSKKNLTSLGHMEVERMTQFHKHYFGEEQTYRFF
jgi:hypothetical protein